MLAFGGAIAGAAGAKALGIVDLFGVAHAEPALAPPPSSAERWGGFLVLPADAPRPALDHEADTRYVPVLEQLEGSDAPPTGITTLTTVEEAARLTKAVHYRLQDVPPGLRERPTEVIQHVSGRVFTTATGYEVVSATGKTIVCARIVLQMEPSLPVPVWLPPETDRPAPEKAAFLSRDGLIFRGPTFTVLQWVQDARLYTGTYLTDVLPMEPTELAAKLVTVGPR